MPDTVHLKVVANSADEADELVYAQGVRNYVDTSDFSIGSPTHLIDEEPSDEFEGIVGIARYDERGVA